MYEIKITEILADICDLFPEYRKSFASEWNSEEVKKGLDEIDLLAFKANDRIVANEYKLKHQQEHR